MLTLLFDKLKCISEEDEVSGVPEITDEMLEFFNERTNRHINLVRKSIDVIVSANPEFKEFDGTELFERGKIHDASKFEDPERTPYIYLTWSRRDEDRGKKYDLPKDMIDDIRKATHHHVTVNSHHPEYWSENTFEINSKDRDKLEGTAPLNVEKMPALDIAEMICDWNAMSVELKRNTLREWWDTVRDKRWHFSEEQETLIEKLIAVFESAGEIKESVFEYDSLWSYKTGVPLIDAWMKNPDYAERKKNKFIILDSMSPDLYLEALKKGFGSKNSDFAFDDRVDELVEIMKTKGDMNIPYLEYENVDGKAVFRQEGRHRSYAAKKLGLTKIPVVVIVPYRDEDYEVVKGIMSEYILDMVDENRAEI